MRINKLPFSPSSPGAPYGPFGPKNVELKSYYLIFLLKIFFSKKKA